MICFEKNAKTSVLLAGNERDDDYQGHDTLLTVMICAPTMATMAMDRYDFSPRHLVQVQVWTALLWAHRVFLLFFFLCLIMREDRHRRKRVKMTRDFVLFSIIYSLEGDTNNNLTVMISFTKMNVILKIEFFLFFFFAAVVNVVQSR